MKRHFSGILALALTAALLLALMPYTALAATKYQLWVGGTEVTGSKTKGDGWIYQAGSNTLTLDNYTYSGKGRTQKYNNGMMDYSAVCYDGNKMLKIVLKGKNRLDIADAKDKSAEIDVILCRSDLEISGDGTLEVKAGACADYSIGIWCGKSITFSGTAVTAVGGKANCSYGISCAENITVRGGKLTAKGAAAEAESYGVYCGKTFKLKDGEVRLIAGKSGQQSFGVNAYDLVVEGGTLTATGGESKQYSIGVFAGGVTISGGTVSAKAAKSQHQSTGLYADHDMTILGGTVLAVGPALDGTEYDRLMSEGIYVQNDLTIEGGDITAESGDVSDDVAQCFSLAVEAFGKVLIKGGKIAGTAGKAIGTDGSSQGITAVKKFVISGGSVTAAAGEANTDSYGIWAQDSLEIGKDVGSLEACGLKGAIWGQVLTGTIGTGWTDAEATEGKATIMAGGEAQTLSFKAVRFPTGIAFGK